MVKSAEPVWGYGDELARSKRSKGADGSDLDQFERLDLLRGIVRGAASEAHKIGKTRVSSHADAMSLRHLDRLINDFGVSGLEAAGDVG